MAVIKDGPSVIYSKADFIFDMMAKIYDEDTGITSSQSSEMR